MTQEEILEYNKRCAEFLGKETKVYSDTPTLTHYRFNNSMLLTKDMKFHSDWNWIMEVVEAIEKIDRKDEHGLFRLIRYGSSCNWNNLPPSINGNTPKQAVVEAINQFLIWYKKNKS